MINLITFTHICCWCIDANPFSNGGSLRRLAKRDLLWFDWENVKRYLSVAWRWHEHGVNGIKGLSEDWIYRVSSPKSHIVSRCFSSFAPSKSPFWAIPFILWQLLGKVRRCRARRADPWDLQPNVGIWTTPYSMGDAMYATGHEPQRMQGMSLLFPPK